MIVVVGGIKGGTGKTTIATNLVVIRSRSGKKVLLVDGDEQKSASMFSEQRGALGIETKWTTIQLGGTDLRKQIARLNADYDDIIIDVGGRETTSQRSALCIASVYLLPFTPASYDVWTAGQANSLIADMRLVNEKLRAIAFVNKADPTGSDNKETLSILEDFKEFECLKFTIGNRKTFRNSASEGKGIVEIKSQDKKAIQEMNELYEYVYKKRTR